MGYYPQREKFNFIRDTQEEETAAWVALVAKGHTLHILAGHQYLVAYIGEEGREAG